MNRSWQKAERSPRKPHNSSNKWLPKRPITPPQTLDVYPEAIIADHRYGYIKSLLRQGVITRKFDADRLYTSDKIDKVLTNRLVGPVLMLAILFALYQFTFSWSEIPVAWLENGFSWLGGVSRRKLPDGLLKSLIISGIIDGVGRRPRLCAADHVHVFRYCHP